MKTPNKPRTMSKTQLAEAYGVHLSTFRKWLTTVPNLHLNDGQRILTPKQVELVMEFLGEP